MCDACHANDAEGLHARIHIRRKTGGLRDKTSLRLYRCKKNRKQLSRDGGDRYSSVCTRYQVYGSTRCLARKASAPTSFDQKQIKRPRRGTRVCGARSQNVEVLQLQNAMNTRTLRVEDSHVVANTSSGQHVRAYRCACAHARIKSSLAYICGIFLEAALGWLYTTCCVDAERERNNTGARNTF